MVTVTATVTIGSGWPNGTPISSQTLDDGRQQHTLEDGRVITVRNPTYRLDYLSSFFDASPGETYEVRVAILGVSFRAGFYEAWNFDSGKLRSYAFRKTVLLTDLETGETLTGADVEAAFKNGTAKKIPP